MPFFSTPEVQAPILFLAGALASGLNTVAGGGSLLTFPTLVALGVPPLAANATNTLALWPGSLGSALGFIGVLKTSPREMFWLLLPSVLGAALGAHLLLQGGERVFSFAVAPLLLCATLLLAVGPKLRARLAGRKVPPWLGVVLQFLIAVYGGYFGAGMGILMLALLAVLGSGDLHAQNAVKAWLGLVVNLVAAVFFCIHGVVHLRAAVWVASGALVGGYAAARLLVRMDPQRLRFVVVVFGVLLTAGFCLRFV